MKKIVKNFCISVLLVCSGGTAFANPSAPRIDEQRAAMSPLAAMDGIWRGPATTDLPDGTKFELTQTERVGPFLDGSVKVIEGRGYGKNREVVFNAFGTISYNPTTKQYTLHSHAQGYVGDHPMKLIPNGFVWELKAGPTTMRFTIVVKDGIWHEVGERIIEGRPTVKFFEMKLKRIGDTTWPAGGAITPE
jgi:hypothetical protein